MNSILLCPMAWSAESLPSNPGAARPRFPVGSEILISILGLGMGPLLLVRPVLSLTVTLPLC